MKCDYLVTDRFARYDIERGCKYNAVAKIVLMFKQSQRRHTRCVCARHLSVLKRKEKSHENFEITEETPLTT